MKHYHIWTIGCQMNVADSQRVGSALEHLGYSHTEQIEAADVIVMNTCVVRQSAEDKAYGRLSSLKPLKQKNPKLIINLMGCLVGVRGYEKLKATFPYVDVFSPPSDPGPLISLLTQGEIRSLEDAETTRRFIAMDEELILPAAERGNLVSAHVPIVYGCSHACTFCIIPYKRGIERSRPVGDIVSEVRALAAQGVVEITLLGQIVDRYGKDIPDGPNLAALLKLVSAVDGIQRVRFLTSHPNYFGEELIQAIASLPKVMPHIELPIQAGDDTVLKNMHRGYTQQDYRDIVAKIRAEIPGCSIATDIIVGFPGETEEDFEETRALMEAARFDNAFIFKYSPREGTPAAQWEDDVPEEEKLRRNHALLRDQDRRGLALNQALVGQTVAVLAEGPSLRNKARWSGRTTGNKIVIFEPRPGLLAGDIISVAIERAAAQTLYGPLMDGQKA